MLLNCSRTTLTVLSSVLLPAHPLPPSWPHSCCCFTTCFYTRTCGLATATSCCPVPAGSTSTPLTSLLSCLSDTCSHMHRRNRGSMQVCWWRGSNEVSSGVQPFQQWFSASHSVSRCSAEISQSLFSFASTISSNANSIYTLKAKKQAVQNNCIVNITVWPMKELMNAELLFVKALLVVWK